MSEFVPDRETARHYRKIIRKMIRARVKFYKKVCRTQEELVYCTASICHLGSDFEEIWRSANNGRYFR